MTAPPVTVVTLDSDLARQVTTRTVALLGPRVADWRVLPVEWPGIAGLDPSRLNRDAVLVVDDTTARELPPEAVASIRSAGVAVVIVTDAPSLLSSWRPAARLAAVASGPPAAVAPLLAHLITARTAARV